MERLQITLVEVRSGKLAARDEWFANHSIPYSANQKTLPIATKLHWLHSASSFRNDAPISGRPGRVRLSRRKRNPSHLPRRQKATLVANLANHERMNVRLMFGFDF